MLASLNILAAASQTLVYTVPTGKTTTFSLSVANRSPSATIAIRIALVGAGLTPALDGSNFIEADSAISPNSTLERTGLVLKAGQQIFVQCDTANSASVVVYGFEE